MSVNIIMLYGKASDSTKYLRFTEEQRKWDLLTFLRDHNIPIASSCNGRAACHRCKINGEILACDITLEDFLKEHGNKIIVDYL